MSTRFPLLLTVILGVATIAFNMVHNAVLETIKTRADVRYLVSRSTYAPNLILYNYNSPQETARVEIFIAGPLMGFDTTGFGRKTYSSFDAIDPQRLLAQWPELRQWYDATGFKRAYGPISELRRENAIKQSQILQALRTDVQRLIAVMSQKEGVESPHLLRYSSLSALWAAVRPSAEQVVREVSQSRTVPMSKDEERELFHQTMMSEFYRLDDEIWATFARGMSQAANAAFGKSAEFAFYPRYQRRGGLVRGGRIRLDLPRHQEVTFNFISSSYSPEEFDLKTGYFRITTENVAALAINLNVTGGDSFQVSEQQELYSGRSPTSAIASYYLWHSREIFKLFGIILVLITVLPLTCYGLWLLLLKGLSYFVTPVLFSSSPVARHRTVMFRSARPGLLQWNVNDNQMPPEGLLTASSCPDLQRRLVEVPLQYNQRTTVYEARLGPFTDYPDIERLNYRIVRSDELQPLPLDTPIRFVSETAVRRWALSFARHVLDIGSASSGVLLLLYLDRWEFSVIRPARFDLWLELMVYLLPSLLVLAVPLGYFIGEGWLFSSRGVKLESRNLVVATILAGIGTLGVYLLSDVLVPKSNYEYRRTWQMYQREEPAGIVRRLIEPSIFGAEKSDREMSISEMQQKLNQGAVSESRRREYLVEIWKHYNLPLSCLLLAALGAQVGLLLRRMCRLAVCRALVVVIGLGLGWLGMVFYVQAESWGDAGQVSPQLAMSMFNIVLLLANIALPAGLLAVSKFKSRKVPLGPGAPAPNTGTTR